MALSDRECELLEAMLEALEPVSARLTAKSRQFVSDQRNRYAEWGNRMMLSPKQWNWLHELYEEFVGPLSELG